MREVSIAGGSVRRALQYLDEGEGAIRDAAVEWFFAAAQGGDADATGWATRPTLEAGLETVRTLARDWIALGIAGSAPLLAPDQRTRLAALPPRDPNAFARLLASLSDARVEIESLLNVLTDRERLVIEHTFGLNNGREYLNGEIAHIIGYSMQMVRYLQQSAMKKLKAAAKRHRNDFLLN